MRCAAICSTFATRPPPASAASVSLPGDLYGFCHGLGAREVAGRRARQAAMHVTADSAHAGDHSGVLDGPVGIEELRAHRTDAGAHRLGDELAQPLAGDDLDVVVEEDDHLALRLAGGE